MAEEPWNQSHGCDLFEHGPKAEMGHVEEHEDASQAYESATFGICQILWDLKTRNSKQ